MHHLTCSAMGMSYNMLLCCLPWTAWWCVQVHKLIFMAPQSEIDAVRSDIEGQLSGIAAVTTALSGMLEVRVTQGEGWGWGSAWGGGIFPKRCVPLDKSCDSPTISCQSLSSCSASSMLLAVRLLVRCALQRLDAAVRTQVLPSLAQEIHLQMFADLPFARGALARVMGCPGC